MFLHGKAILHVVNTASRYSAATFLDAHGAHFENLFQVEWFAIVVIWFLTYTRYPKRSRTDQGSVIASDHWENLTNLNGAQL